MEALLIVGVFLCETALSEPQLARHQGWDRGFDSTPTWTAKATNVIKLIFAGSTKRRPISALQLFINERGSMWVKLRGFVGTNQLILSSLPVQLALGGRRAAISVVQRIVNSGL